MVAVDEYHRVRTAFFHKGYEFLQLGIDVRHGVQIVPLCAVANTVEALVLEIGSDQGKGFVTAHGDNVVENRRLLAG